MPILNSINSLKKVCTIMKYSTKNIAIAILAIGLVSVSIFTASFLLSRVNDPLSDQEVADLVFNREEEKLARDVYLTLYDTWNYNVFSNIAPSEQIHMDSILDLLNKYGIEDPVPADTVGVYNNSELTDLYNDLVSQGQPSLVDALEVGGYIEEMDILDLLRFIANSDHPDVIAVYERLMMGSRNHLRAFVGALADEGITYVPVLMEEAAYQAIITTPIEQGP